jgi:hypothetical protein
MNENEHRNAHTARTLPPAPASPKNSHKLRLVGELLRAHDRRLESDDQVLWPAPASRSMEDLETRVVRGLRPLSLARHQSLSGTHVVTTRKTIGKPSAGTPDARTERGMRNGPTGTAALTTNDSFGEYLK